MNYAEKVRALLAKAESTTHPAEAEALTAKAEALIVKHSIDIAKLLDRKPDELKYLVYRWHDYLAIGRRRLVTTLSMHLPGTEARYWVTHRGRGQKVAIWTNDSSKHTLIQSALIQAEISMQVWWGMQDAAKTRAYALKNNYLWGFGAGMGLRLASLVEEHDTGKTLVHVDNKVRQAVDSQLGQAKQGAKSKMSTMSGFSDGVADGETAILQGRELL